MKVLSIDFDYFQKVNADFIAWNYPDGHDFGGDIALAMWSGHYGEEIIDGKADIMQKNVEIDKEELDILKRIINRNCGKVVDALITQSHKDIYDYILSRVKGKKHIDLVNVDMHHDMVNDNENLDCGNWIGKLVEAHPNTSVRWVANSISEEAYGLGNALKEHILHSLKEIENEDFDYIFLCRSDVWLPPHLDNYFDELKETICDNVNEVLYNRALDRNRMETIVEMRKQMKEQLEQLKLLNKKVNQ